jgi:hypothetical protein
MGFLRRLLGTVKPDAVRHAAWVVVPHRPDARVAVVGADGFQPALRRIAGGPGDAGPRRADHLAALIPEPENASDEHAVCIRIDGRRVGYLDPEMAIAYEPVLRLAATRGRLIAVEATLRSAADRIDVTLHLGTPGETLLQVLDAADEPIAVRTDHPWREVTVTFSGDSPFGLGGVAIDRPTAAALAVRAGLFFHPRMTRNVGLFVECVPGLPSRDRDKAVAYGTPIITETEFWSRLGVAVDRRLPDLETQPDAPWSTRRAPGISLPEREPVR